MSIQIAADLKALEEKVKTLEKTVQDLAAQLTQIETRATLTLKKAK
jgi:uncharacterized protein YoxC